MLTCKELAVRLKDVSLSLGEADVFFEGEAPDPPTSRDS